MEQDQLEEFRQRLKALKDEIEQLESANREASGTVALDQSKVGRLSRMDAMQAQQMAHETARRRQTQLQKIDGALRRIEAGDYGYCFVCGEEISPAGSLCGYLLAAPCLRLLACASLLAPPCLRLLACGRHLACGYLRLLAATCGCRPATSGADPSRADH